MNVKNYSRFKRPGFLITILISIIAVGFLPLVVDAAHPPGSETVSNSVDMGSNIISFRDSTNIMLQSSTVSLDTSTIKAGFVTIIVEEEDANLDSSGIDIVLSSATSTSSGLVEATVELSETSEDSGIFTGKLFISLSGPTSGDTLELGLGDDISIFYDPEPLFVGRFSADVDVTSMGGTVTTKDFIVADEDNYCNNDLLVTHPIEVALLDDTTSDPANLKVTISYANANLGGLLSEFNFNEKYHDFNTNGIFDVDETVYKDNDGSGTVTVGDTRLANAGSQGLFLDGSDVAAGDSDLGNLLREFNFNEKYNDSNSNDSFDVGETVYKDADGSGTVTSGDTRLANAGIQGFLDGSVVAPGNNDARRLPLTIKMLYRDGDFGPFEPLTPKIFGVPNLDLRGHDLDAMTITNLDSPPFVEGQYALGINALGSCGGGGGGLVRPGLVVNVLAGSGSLIGLFSGGSGGGVHPTFGDASFLVLENVSDGFGGTISEGDDISLDSTKVVETGDTAVLRFELYENQGITNLERFRMFLNFEGENYDASIIDTHITYKRSGEITIVDPHEKFEKVEIEILQVDPWNLIVNVKIIFKNTFNTSILVDSWDLDRNSGKKLFPDALEVVEPSILLADAQKVLNEPTPDLTLQVITETELTEIPVWIKSNALWWQQKQIDDSDFMAGIEYLIKKSLIEIDENDLSYSETSKETPLWISDVAGMWANDSITDEEFIDAMKWLITNGILQVQQ